MRWLVSLSVALFLILLFSSWGFYAHRTINEAAVFTLPVPLVSFYKKHITYIKENAVDADKRRYVNSGEAERHFIDIDAYDTHLFDSIPLYWQDAINKIPEDTLRANGILPWQIHFSYMQLVNAFKEKNTQLILRVSADIGHYIADAHSPLHTTKNYNGQLTDQEGIHAFWESRLPELYAPNYNFFVGRAQYIESPLLKSWEIIKHSFSLTDSVLMIEKRLNQEFPDDQKYIFENRNNSLIKSYSQPYSKAYHQALNGMIERQMRAAIITLSSFWYSAWVDAGQPDL
ncbi:zinc dependent phospholipase C family protein [Albibacterium sp.]|uniref:zinc dependent phospholipase C family protein n=1 Tax=Albibacterium sp. TaxID=2952885 RepID=UPI002C0BD9FE|nr:zinc dependent phospholipase C family protein [Albibacterium sp.]HUH19237.1 zinc dependent phospholipase C family protein [Albibacterium sp.]